MEKEKYFRCRECGGNFKEEYKILYGPNRIEICEFCWEEIHYNLRKSSIPTTGETR
jgi:hypothetical protein